MELMKKLLINPSEEFPLYNNPPILEATLDIRIKSAIALDEKSVKTFAGEYLSGYVFLDSQRSIRHEVKISEGNAPQQTTTDSSWAGVRFQSDDGKRIVQFNREGFVFSKLAPYDNWESFQGEGLSLWETFQKLAKPEAVNRIGLRFINRITMPVGDFNFEHYIQPAPASPVGLDVPFHGYTHQDTLAVPGHKYAINIVRAIQPPQDQENEGLGLIVDIDVFTTDAPVDREISVPQMLNEMRWLKNKVFFGSVTAKTLEGF